jgi:hypothetical protein
MSEFEDIQKLIRLKRYEKPPEDFVEDFLASFKERQRAEMLHRSARGLLWERVTTYFSEFLSPKWAWAGATVAAVALLGVSLRPHGGSGPQVAQNHQEGFEVNAFSATDPNAVMADVENYLRAREFEPDNGHNPQGIKPRVVQRPQGEILPAGLGYRPSFIIKP